MNLVIYESNSETLVCTKKDEKKLIKEYFKNGGRSLDEYDRSECAGIIEIRSKVITSVEEILK